jgi:Fatty acid hydroxylase superfamily
MCAMFVFQTSTITKTLESFLHVTCTMSPTQRYMTIMTMFISFRRYWWIWLLLPELIPCRAFTTTWIKHYPPKHGLRPPSHPTSMKPQREVNEVPVVFRELASSRHSDSLIGILTHDDIVHNHSGADQLSLYTTPSVPTTWKEAFRVFFASPQYHGPRLIVLFVSILFYLRIELGFPMSTTSSGLEEIGVAVAAVVFWWFQEHVMHQHLLHSTVNWMGKDIHVQHHNQPYHHISIDPAPIMISWLTLVHVILRYGFGTVWPLSFVYTATIAYGMAGLFYEWTHFIVHTKIRFSPHSFWTKVKNHHARHHLVNHDNYFAFSVTHIDDIFGTNPDVSMVPRLKKMR